MVSTRPRKLRSNPGFWVPCPSAMWPVSIVPLQLCVPGIPASHFAFLLVYLPTLTNAHERGSGVSADVRQARSLYLIIILSTRGSHHDPPTRRRYPPGALTSGRENWTYCFPCSSRFGRLSSHPNTIKHTELDVSYSPPARSASSSLAPKTKVSTNRRWHFSS